MGLVASLFAPPRSESPYKPWDDFWYQNAVGIGTSVGIAVTPLVALQVAAVFACVKVISETLASLPLIVYRRRKSGGKDRATDHPLYSILHDSPNAWQTAFEFIEDQTGHAALHGRCFAQILPGTLGSVGELVPIHPDRVRLEQLPNRRIRYQVREQDGTTTPLTQDEMLHVRGRSLDFVNGLSTQQQARDAIALARAIETFGARFFANDASVGLVLEHPAKLSKEAQQRLEDGFKARSAGLINAHKPKVLEEGMKVSRVPMTSAKDSQLTDAQEAAVLVICRYFRMPPHKIQHLLNATFSNIEHQGIEFVTDTMMPWARRWEQRINASLVSDPDQFFAEFLLVGLLRGDAVARSQYYTSRFNIGTLSPNDIRELENENPIDSPWANRYFVQGAMVPLDRIDSFVGGKSTGAQDPASDAPPPNAPRRAFRTLASDAAERIARAEVREIEQRGAKLAKTPEKLTGWLAAFYTEHTTYVARTLRPLAEAWEEETGRRIDVAALAAAVADGRFAIVNDFTAEFSEWREERAAAITLVLRQEFDRDQAH